MKVFNLGIFFNKFIIIIDFVKLNLLIYSDIKVAQGLKMIFDKKLFLQILCLSLMSNVIVGFTALEDNKHGLSAPDRRLVESFEQGEYYKLREATNHPAGNIDLHNGWLLRAGVEGGDYHMIKTILDKEASVGNDNGYAFKLAALANREDIVDLMLRYGVSKELLEQTRDLADEAG